MLSRRGGGAGNGRGFDNRGRIATRGICLKEFARARAI